MASEREDFSVSGPLHLDVVNWDNADHRRSVAACLVQGVYMLERDRQEKRQGDEALAPPWWKFFDFKLYRQLVDNADSSIFGAVYEYTPPGCNSNELAVKCPRYVIAFRGTITKGDAFSRDLELDMHIIRNELHFSSRFETGIQAVRNVVATFGSSNIWLAGHSLGAAIAMLAGKTMAKTGVFLEAFLFNSPYLSAPVERIKDKKVKHGIRIATSVITAGLAFASSVKSNNRQKNLSRGSSFAAISRWVPCLFVNPADHICSEYIGYFEHRKKMEDIGIGAIEKLATQHSVGGLFMNLLGKDSEEPMHLIPSAALTVNLTPSPDFKEAHGIHQWWRPALRLDSKTYLYS
nr:GDSL esterase/lipase At4g10955-like [Ipomoea batatas]GMD11787.1 GDSL esterase/lipase At4g10955-like [Ipomoea batatas]